MQIIKSFKSLRSQIHRLKTNHKSIGFVPTMGALHEGHLSLLRKSRRENDITVLSIYVNPTQFDPKKEDFSSYPSNKKTDISLAKGENVDIIFLPTTKQMYPEGFSSSIQTDHLTDSLCGRSRPGHFKGVTTIVGKLINLVSPDVMYLGQKDAQQAIVLAQMVKDLNFNTRIKICPTVRETDGLALSSRNQYLSIRHRQQAPVLYQALRRAKHQIRSGDVNSRRIKQSIRKMIEQTDGRVDYIECVDVKNLKPVNPLKGKILIALAVKFNSARLIDNIVVNVR